MAEGVRYQREVSSVRARIAGVDSAEFADHSWLEALLLTAFGLLLVFAFAVFLLAWQGFPALDAVTSTGIWFLLALTLVFAYFEAAFWVDAFGFRLPLRILQPGADEARVWRRWWGFRRRAISFLRLWNGSPNHMLASLVGVDRDVKGPAAVAYAQALVDKHRAHQELQQVEAHERAPSLGLAFIGLGWVAFFFFITWMLQNDPKPRVAMIVLAVGGVFLTFVLLIAFRLAIRTHGERLVRWARVLRQLEGFERT